MKVKDLIELLGKCNPDACVITTTEAWNSNSPYTTLDTVSIITEYKTGDRLPGSPDEILPTKNLSTEYIISNSTEYYERQARSGVFATQDLVYIGAPEYES